MTEARALVPAERRNITAVAPILNGAADSDRASNLGRRAPPIAIAADPVVSTDPVVLLGRAALKRRNAAEREKLLDEPRIWPDYVEVGQALMVGRAWAMAKAHINKPSGKNYSREFGRWLQANQLHGKYLDKDHRSKLLTLMVELPQVEAWRASLEEKKRANHPYNVWAAWECPNRGGRWRAAQDAASTSTSTPTSTPTNLVPMAPMAAPAETADGESESESESEHVSADTQVGRMIVLANKIAGMTADLRQALRQFRGELNETVVQAVRHAAVGTAETANDFERRLRLQQECEPARERDCV